MANSKSALKRVRQTQSRSARNKALTGRMKTLRKNTLLAASSGDTKKAQDIFSEFSSAVDKCSKKGIIHNNKAANLKSKTCNHLKPANS